MEPFSHINAVAAPLGLSNIDTDQIIPGRFLKTVERRGLGKFLFHDFRYDEAGGERTDFVLNQPAYRGAGILIAGENFGCGSSREHAPWALLDSGIRCVIAPSFADIFFNNAAINGILLITLPSAKVDELMEEARGGNHLFSVDLKLQTVTTPSGEAHRFDIDPLRKDKLLKGLDPIGETIQQAPAIEAFEQRRRQNQPWLAH